MTAFIPTTPVIEDQTIVNDGWFPDLSVSAMQAETGLGNTPGTDRIVAAIRAAMIEINSGLATWRAGQVADTLAAVPATSYGDISEKVILYQTAVYARARAQLLDTTRDYDSTKDGHDRADALEATADDYMRQSNEALSRLMGRPRMVVELI